MESNLHKIMVSSYKYRLEFNFGDYFINIQPTCNGNATLFSNYPSFINRNDNIIEIITLHNAREVIILFDGLPRIDWKRIKIKFYGSNMSESDIINIRT